MVVGFGVGGGEGAVNVSSATTVLSNEISHLKCQPYLRITPAPAQPIWPALPMEGAAHRGPPLSVQGGKNHSRPLSSTLSALLPFLRVAAVHKEGCGRRVSKNELCGERRFSVPLNEAPPYLKGSAVRVSSVKDVGCQCGEARRSERGVCVFDSPAPLPLFLSVTLSWRKATVIFTAARGRQNDSVYR